MSHFTVGVIVQNPVGDLESLVNPLLVPYSENIRVEPYMKTCPCCNGAGEIERDGIRTTCPCCDGNKEYETTYNPDAKWDWFVIGGRWDNIIDGNWCKVSDLKDNPFFAIVTPDGEWHEKGHMGLWTDVTNANAHWDEDAIALFEQYSDHFVILVDAHI